MSPDEFLLQKCNNKGTRWFHLLSMTGENSLQNWTVLFERRKNSFSTYCTIHNVAATAMMYFKVQSTFLMFIYNFLKSTADNQQNNKPNSDLFCLPIFIA